MISDHLALSSRSESVGIQKTEQDGQKTEQGVQKNERCTVRERISNLHWDDLDLLRGVSTANSLRQAAHRLSISVNTVRSRISRLEEALGITIIDRSKDRLVLTKNGIDVLDVALEMQLLRGRLEIGAGNNSVLNDGEIAISCTEGIGEFWLSSFLPDLRLYLPNYVISLNNDFDQIRIHSKNCDISIGFNRPTDQNAIVKRLSILHFMVFASPKYLDKMGVPDSLDDLEGHSFVSQVAPGLNYDAVELFVGSVKAESFVTMKVNTSFSLFRAIVNGEAMGVLPTYAAAICKDIVPLDLPVQLKFELWLSFNRASKNSIPVRQTISWLERCFDKEKFPWFSDKFIHPRDFAGYAGRNNFLNETTKSLIYLD